MRRTLVIGGALVLAGGVMMAIGFTRGGSGSPEVPTPGVVATSAPLPSVAGTTLDGATFSTRAARGHVVVLNFWNPYCQPCRVEAPALDLAEGRLAPEGVVIAGVLFSNGSFPHDVGAAQRFARLNGERYPTIDDPTGQIANAFGVHGIPTTVVADATGRIRYEVFGGVKPGELERLVRRVQRR